MASNRPVKEQPILPPSTDPNSKVDLRTAVPSKKTVQQYISRKKLDDFFVELTENVLIDMPDNPVRFIIDYLYRAYPRQSSNSSFSSTFAAGETHGGGVVLTGLCKDDELAHRDSVEDDYESQCEEENSENKEQKEALSSTYVGLSSATQFSRASRRRKAVCSFVATEPLEPWTTGKPIAQEPRETKQLRRMLMNAVILSNLECPVSVFDELVQSMEPIESDVGKVLVKQGSVVPGLIAITQGKCSVTRENSEEENAQGKEPRRVLECQEGACFGELALLYDEPSPATLATTTLVKAWLLRRTSYEEVLKSSRKREMSQKLSLIQDIPVFQTLEEVEINRLADAFRREIFKEGEIIIKQNEKGKKFYIIETGTVVVTQQRLPFAAAQRVAVLGPKTHFGEIALISDRPRAATVTADSEEVVCLSISRGEFTRTFGNLIDVLKRDMRLYRCFISDKI